MNANFLGAVGYLSVFLPLACLIAGLTWDLPYLTVLVVFCVGPLLRPVLGNLPDELPAWDETTSRFLDRLPTAYAMAFPLLLGWVLLDVHAAPPIGIGSWIWLGLSLWTCLFFAVVVAHELVHQGRGGRRLAWLLAGAAGYPLFAHEHLRHHSVSGSVDLAEWPGLNESVWRFVVRRTARVIRSAVEYNSIVAINKRRSSLHGGLFEAFVAMAITALAFFAAAGTKGLVVYLLAAAGVNFGVQAITYIQHWGLGVDSVERADENRYAWEDRCRFQGWLMLHLALHHAHHQASATPYYRLAPHAASPRTPAGYVVLLLASFVPPLWRRLMTPPLESWKRDPYLHIEPSRWRLICLPAHYDGVPRG